MEAFFDQLLGCVAVKKDDLTVKMCRRIVPSAKVYENGMHINTLRGTVDTVLSDVYKIYKVQFETAPSILSGRSMQQDSKTTITRWSTCKSCSLKIERLTQ